MSMFLLTMGGVNAKNPDFLKYGNRVNMFLVLFVMISIKQKVQYEFENV
jgi:hypothetical protein